VFRTHARTFVLRVRVQLGYEFRVPEEIKDVRHAVLFVFQVFGNHFFQQVLAFLERLHKKVGVEAESDVVVAAHDERRLLQLGLELFAQHFG